MRSIVRRFGFLALGATRFPIGIRESPALLPHVPGCIVFSLLTPDGTTVTPFPCCVRQTPFSEEISRFSTVHRLAPVRRSRPAPSAAAREQKQMEVNRE